MDYQYTRHDHAQWMENTLAHMRAADPKHASRYPEKLSEFQVKVVDILGMVGDGIYNAPIFLEKIDWCYGFDGVSVLWDRDLSTWDFNRLTMLVFLCHAARIRCEVTAEVGFADADPTDDPEGPELTEAYGILRLSFWPRVAIGDMSQRHPNLAEAVEWFENEYLPKDHRVRYQEKVTS
jgi:hypothetical protein